MSNIVHGLRTFDVTEDGSEKVEYSYSSFGNIGATNAERESRKYAVQGMYCRSEDALQYIQVLLAYREGHSERGSGQECYIDDSGDFRCPLCREVDRVTGKEQHDGALDSMLASLRSVNNGL